MSEGAAVRATPLVPWAHTTTGHPRAGGRPLGSKITPEAGTSVPATDREW
jgi:hypothetical protein